MNIWAHDSITRLTHGGAAIWVADRTWSLALLDHVFWCVELHRQERWPVETRHVRVMGDVSYGRN